MLATVLIATALIGQSGSSPAPRAELTPGQLVSIDRQGKPGALCPLKGTKVNADIAGFGARVTVVQTFSNPSKGTIEAVYAFPLPADAAVDRMRMKVGDRIISGVIKKRDEARAIYEQAKHQGKTASLLDQERPNLFTQSVANITPGAVIQIEISYVQVLKYEDGAFEFVFPMVVGPRYLGTNTPDPGKIAPPIVAKGTRSGAGIELNVEIDAGSKIEELKSELHEVRIISSGDSTAKVSLLKKVEIPNRDFILRYRMANDSVKTAFLTHANPQQGGFFTLIVMPPKAPTVEQIAPKEMIFVMDQSGSQLGFPIEKSKELTEKLIESMHADDTFNVITFNTGTKSLWPNAVANNRQNRSAAIAFIDGLHANGGTELLSGVLAAMKPAPDPQRLRIVLFNTDGFVGNEFEVLRAVQDYRGTARMFTYGIGNSVNRFLIDAMGAEGRGASEIVTLVGDAEQAAQRFVKRLRSPVLTDINVKFFGGDTFAILPRYIPDVFSESPVIMKGRYATPGHARIEIIGKLGGDAWKQTLNFNLPELDQSGSAIGTLWARQKVDDLMRQDWMNSEKGNGQRDLAGEITQIGLQFGIMTQYTSFVAVEDKVVNVGGKQQTVQVPVEMADGVSYEGTFGNPNDPLFINYATGNILGRSGGFGGGGPPGSPNLSPAPGNAKTAPLGIRFVSADSSLLERSDTKIEKMTTAERSAHFFKTKVSTKLQKLTTGTVEIQIWLKNLVPETLAKLREIGLKIEGKDASLNIVFCTSDAKKLKQLAQLEFVNRIEPMLP